MRSPPGSTPISTDYVLTLADGGYRFNGKVLPFKIAHKSYKVRQPDGSLKTVTFDQRIAVQGPVFNIVYGDRQGHILYIDNGILPKHPGGGDLATWSKPVPGDASATL
jgi:acyl-homoserine-lactone acylase